MNARPVFLLTDFGLSDPYVGIMKAVLARLSPDSPVHDITHNVGPQDVAAAAVILEDSFPWLPNDAVVCAVVDPGVGSARRSIAVQIGNRFCVGPDNGLFSLVGSGDGRLFFELVPGEHIRPERSATFHGRDVYAPAAAMIARGDSIHEFAKPIHHITTLDFPKPVSHDSSAVQLCVLALDHFGNAALNLKRSDLPRDLEWIQNGYAEVSFSGRTIRGIDKTFSDVAPGEPVVYWNSFDRLEIAINRGSIAREFGLSVGSVIMLKRSATK